MSFAHLGRLEIGRASDPADANKHFRSLALTYVGVASGPSWLGFASQSLLGQAPSFGRMEARVAEWVGLRHLRWRQLSCSGYVISTWMEGPLVGAPLVAYSASCEGPSDLVAPASSRVASGVAEGLKRDT